MSARPHGPPAPEALRAAKLSRVPGVTIAEAARRFGVSAAAISRARKLPETAPSPGELALAALTRNGTLRAGTLGDLTAIAAWVDYVEHDGCTAAEARALLAKQAELEIRGERWRLLVAWP